MKDILHVAVTGLNATDNPGPGVSVIRALRHHPDFNGRIIGLAYDNLEPGIYAKDLVDDVFLIPYPSQGVDALEARLEYIHKRVRFDAIIPTLDSELAAFIDLSQKLTLDGIGLYLPTREQLDFRSKARLVALGESAGIAVPKTEVVREAKDLFGLHDTLGFPLVIKGPFYGAIIAYSIDEAVQAFHTTVAKWGAPVLAQEHVTGVEYDVVAVGDGEGRVIGAVPMRKTFLTDKGKGWAGVTVSDENLLEVTQKFFQATSWRGPCEVEVVRTSCGQYHLLEINPRFPAWVYLSAAAGLNLPYATLQLALSQDVVPSTDYRPGTMFVRISVDQVANLDDFQQLAMTGELLSQGAIQ